MMKKVLLLAALLLGLSSIPSFAENMVGPNSQSPDGNPVYSAFARIVNIDQPPLTLESGQLIQIPLTTTMSNYGNMVNDETNGIGGYNLKINDTGVYTVNIYLNFGNNPNGQRGFQITSNNGQLWRQYYNAVGGDLPNVITATYTLKLMAGDVLRLLAYQNTGSTLTMGNWNQMSVTKIGELKN
jgi:hypothetical protein